MVEILIGALVVIGAVALYARFVRSGRAKKERKPNLYPFY